MFTKITDDVSAYLKLVIGETDLQNQYIEAGK